MSIGCHYRKYQVILNIILIFLLFLSLRIFVVDTYLVSQNSMNNTLFNGDKVMVSKISAAKKGKVLVLKQEGQIFIKRCIALSGETVNIVNNDVFTDGIPAYTVQTIIRNNDSSKAANPLDTGKEMVDKDVFACYNRYWTLNNFGPFKVPGKGQSITLNDANKRLYNRIIEQELKEEGKELSQLSGNSYTFKHNYIFVLGDNRPASRDSRTFGVIKTENIIGVAKWIVYSKSNFFGNGFFRAVH